MSTLADAVLPFFFQPTDRDPSHVSIQLNIHHPLARVIANCEPGSFLVHMYIICLTQVGRKCISRVCAQYLDPLTHKP